MRSATRNVFSASLAATCLCIHAYSQTDTISRRTYDAMSLKDLLSIKVVSVSKTAESLFDAPLSASVITKEDIVKSGCTSIMEALRLMPGLIVREQSNGNYDIHLRGMDNVPPNASFDLTSNTTTLVMVNNHPIYSYLRGGTFWETLPVDLNDVEKIEVVRGPAAALYGPNAVNGVINIITREIEKKGWFVQVNNRQGSNHTLINNASVGYRFNRLSIMASGNFQQRDRSQTSYYEYIRNQWFSRPEYMIRMEGDTVQDVSALYPTHNLSMKKYAGNVFATYHLSEKNRISLATGIQHSQAQRVAIENAFTPLSYALSNTRYADLRGNLNNFTAQLSYTSGSQSLEQSPGNKYDFTIFNGNLEYNFTQKRFSIKPGISYQSAVYDDTKYSDIAHRTGMFNTRGLITTASASLHSEYKLFSNKLRLVGAVALNKFNYPDTTYLSYQLAATFKLNKKNLVRAVISGAPRSSNVFDTYVDQTFYSIPSGPNTYDKMAIRGNKDLHLLTAKMIEVGYRNEITRHMSVDAELFNIRSKNYSLQVIHKPFTMVAGPDTINMIPIMTTNLPMQLEQSGITVSVTINTRRFKIKTFATWQQTRIKDYVVSNFMPDAGFNTPDIYSGMGNRSRLNSTPALFGGGTIDYRLSRKTNLNISSYYFTRQQYYHITNMVFNDGVRGIDHIPGKFIVNANISYEPVKGLQLFCAGKNLLSQTTREFFYTDKVPFMLMGGVSYQLQ